MNRSTDVSPAVVEVLAAVVGDRHVITDRDELVHYGRDWTRFYEPTPVAAVLPGSVDEVQKIVAFANEHGIALVPSGGRTGLSAAAVAANGEVVVALDRMNRILDFNEIDRTVVCQAGIITAELQQFALDKGLFYPVDFASAGSSRIGGNIGTNAGGIKVIRYGMTRDWILGLKVVTGAGEVLELNHGLIKNNAGYDLRQLFIGAEGTLGIVVEATIRLARQPRDLQVMVLGVERFDALMEVLKSCQQRLDVTAFEFFSEAALEKVVEHQQLKRPFETQSEFYALVEFEAGNGGTDEAMAVFEQCVEQGWVSDGTISQSESQAINLWRLREDISESLSHYTPYKNDLSVRVSRVPEFIERVDKLVHERYPEFEIVWFGHIGDGNAHLNILKPGELSTEEFKKRCDIVSDEVFALIAEYNGSVSAEHGVGLIKKHFLHYSRSSEEIALMRAIKRAFDPNGIMNPGKIFDTSND